MESPIHSYLRQIHAEIAQLKDGKPYSTIPAMANVDPDNFGIALATVDGTGLRNRGHPRGIHHPVHLQALHLRAGP